MFDKLYNTNFYKKNLQKVESFERKRLEERGAIVSDQAKYNTYIENQAKNETQGKVIMLAIIIILILLFLFR